MGGNTVGGALRRRHVGVLLGVTLLATAAALPLRADAADQKTFTLTTSIPHAGVSSAFTMTLSNTATSPQQLGSANITIPFGVVPTAEVGEVSTATGSATVVGRTLQLRDLNLSPGDAVIVTVPGYTTCLPTGTELTWLAQVKQANDFNGTGNDFTGAAATSTSSGQCGVAFLPTRQPANADRSKVITSEAYVETGAPVSVEVLDANGQRSTWWTGPLELALGADNSVEPNKAALAGEQSVSTAAGVATFAPSIDVSAAGYTLVAQITPGTTLDLLPQVSTTAESIPFTIVDDGNACKEGTSGSSCSALSSNGRTTASVDVAIPSSTPIPDGTTVADVDLSIAPPQIPAFTCGEAVTAGDPIEFNVVERIQYLGSTGQKRVSIKVDMPLDIATRRYNVCFARPASYGTFTTQSGASATLNDPLPLVPGDEYYVGYLPSCGRRPAPPCAETPVVDRKASPRTATFSFLAPAGDPWGKVAG